VETFKPSAWQLWWKWTHQYEVTEDALTIRTGVAVRRHNRVPREKITNVDLTLSHLVPGRSSVLVNVGSGEPVKCPGLTKSEARRLAAALETSSVSGV
jgi:membrane protein YdbS with pleckstrin-like domain